MTGEIFPFDLFKILINISLDIPPPSDKIVKEKEFIEATSSISSFNVMSRPGIPISPIEVRLTKDRLSLVSRVLSSTNDAYKHTQIILDLAYKLGYRDDPVAKTRVLAMIADTALQAEDFDTAFDTSEDMVASVLELRASLAGSSDPRVEEASEVCWVACYQLGRQPEFPDVNKKMSLLGRALELCPADRLPDILTAWRRLETEFLEERESRSTEPRGRRIRAAARSHVPSLLTPLSAPVAASAASLASRLQQGLHMSVPSSPDAAALASKTLSRVAAGFSFGRRDRSVDSVRPSSYARSGSREGSISRPGSTAPGQASRALQKGIGWLIGADGE
jgi:neuroblastoma-amplified sequence